MAWSLMLIVMAILFAVGFVWPALWLVAIVAWLISILVWGASRRPGGPASIVEGERPRARIE